jgi:hypothetical protein
MVDFAVIDLMDIGKLQALSLLNFVLALFLSWFSAQLSRKMHGKSFSTTLKIIALALLVFAAHQAATIFAPIKTIRWDIVLTLSDTLFILLIFYGLLKLGPSLQAYQHIIRKRH